MCSRTFSSCQGIMPRWQNPDLIKIHNSSLFYIFYQNILLHCNCRIFFRFEHVHVITKSHFSDMKEKWAGLAQPTRTLGLFGAHTGPGTLVRAAFKSIYHMTQTGIAKVWHVENSEKSAIQNKTFSLKKKSNLITYMCCLKLLPYFIILYFFFSSKINPLRSTRRSLQTASN